MRLVLAILFTVAVFSGLAFSQPNYRAEIEKWRTAHEAELTADDGWLTVTGLFWLKEGSNTVGSIAGSDVELTDNFKGGKFGKIDLHDGKVILTVDEGVDATVDGKTVKTAELMSDEKGKPSLVKVGSQTFYRIKRGDKLGIRLKDTASKARCSFTHLNWYPIDSKFRVSAKFERYAEPREVLIPNVLGGTVKMMSPGLLRFTLNCTAITLEPVDEDGKLFINFRDATSRTTTYAAGRFLYADAPLGDTVILDFNKAENPPCAFTQFATCPLPPQQNRLSIEIRAGEKRYGH